VLEVERLRTEVFGARAEHLGPKPLNFEHADQIVLLGKYSPERDIFEADRVLVKCPSKYRSRK